jgi:hypothetical protein
VPAGDGRSSVQGKFIMDWLDVITLLGTIAVVIAALCYPINRGNGRDREE